MNIAYIVPSLANKGPVIVVRELVKQFVKNGHLCTVFYLDNKIEVEFDCPVQRIHKGFILDFSKYDIVHSHGMRPDKYVFNTRFRNQSNVICLSTIHSYLMLDFKYQYNWIVAFVFGNLWMRRWLSRHDKIICLSKHAKKYYGKWFASNKLIYAYNTRDPDNSKKLGVEELNEILTFKGNKKLIGVNALLSPVKGIDILIKSLPDLPDHKLFIVGNGQSRSKLEKLAYKLGVEQQCYFAGYRKDAFRYLEQYDIYALPSRSEGFPLSLLEAAVYRCPTVCSDIPIVKEAFAENEISFFELSNPHTIVEAILHATNNKEIGERMYEKYLSSYSPSSMYNRYLEIYNGKI